MNIPVGAISCLLILRFVPDLAPEAPRPFDLRGFLLAAVAMTGLLLGLDRIGSPAGTWHVPAASLLIGAAAAVLLVRHSRNHPAPLLSLAPLQSGIYRIAVLGGGALIRISIRALPFVLPLMFQLAMGMSAFAAGLTLITLNGADLVIKPLIRRILQRFGYRANLLATCLASAAGTAACAAFSTETPYWVILAALALLGAARSILFTGVQTLLYAEIPENQTISATVLWNVFQQLTSAVGVCVSAILLNGLAAMHGRWGETPSLFDFRIVLLFLALLIAASAISFRRLAPDAGAELSGHRNG